MQNFMSVLLFIVSITYLYERRFLYYIFLNLIGLSFHLSSLIYFPLYFLVQRSIGMRWGFISIFAANLFYFIGSDLVTDMLFRLVSNSSFAAFESYLYFFIDSSSYELSFGFLERTLVIILMTLYYEKIKLEILHGTVFYNLALLYYCSFLLLSPVAVLADRVPILFLASYWIIIPGLIISKHRYRTIIACALITLGFTKLILSTQDQVARYENLLFEIESYDQRKSGVLEHNYQNHRKH